METACCTSSCLLGFTGSCLPDEPETTHIYTLSVLESTSVVELHYTRIYSSKAAVSNMLTLTLTLSLTLPPIPKRAKWLKVFVPPKQPNLTEVMNQLMGFLGQLIGQSV